MIAIHLHILLLKSCSIGLRLEISQGQKPSLSDQFIKYDYLYFRLLI